MKNRLIITDHFQVRLDQSLIDIRDDYMGGYIQRTGVEHPSGLGMMPGTEEQPDEMNSNQSGLFIRIAATHSGVLTSNHALYLPAMMADSVSTFVDDYPKPILVHHEKEQDPIGRVASAKYIDLSGIVKDHFVGRLAFDRHGNTRGTVTKKVVDDFVQGSMSWNMQADTVLNVLNSAMLHDDNYAGLGYIEIIANITDPDAIQKILDGRYLTGSVSFSSDKAMCSICRKEWVSEGRCDHTPGTEYEDQLCYLIMGKMAFKEYSLVNIPADKLSKILEIQYNGTQDSFELPSGDSMAPICNLYWADLANMDNKEEGMLVTDKTQEDAVTDPVVEASAEGEIAEGQATDDSVTEKNMEIPVDANATDDSSEGTDDSVSDDIDAGAPENTETNDTEDPVEVDDFTKLFDKLLAGGKLTKDESSQLYDLQYAEMEAAVVDGEIKDALSEDAKLDAAKLKKLPKSTFCGPGRSFPATDTAHVLAARRLVTKYSGSGDKTKVEACINRKVKAMGCDQAPVQTTEPAKLAHDQLIVSFNQFVGEINDDQTQRNIADSVVKILVDCLEAGVLKDSLVDNELAMDSECEQSMIDEVIQNEETIGQLRDELNDALKAVGHVRQDSNMIEDETVQLRAELRKSRENQLLTLKKIKNDSVDPTELGSWDDSTLISELGIATKAVDFSSIPGTLSDGMTTIPVETIESPVGVSSGIPTEQTIELTDAQKDEFREQYILLRLTKGEACAEDYKRTWFENVINTVQQK